MDNKKSSNNNKPDRKRTVMFLLLALFAVILLVVLLRLTCGGAHVDTSGVIDIDTVDIDTTVIDDDTLSVDTVDTSKILRDTATQITRDTSARITRDTSTRVTRDASTQITQITTIDTTSLIDSAAIRDSISRALAALADSIAANIPQDNPCAIDTVPPWVFPDPSGGLHRRAPLSVRLFANKNAVIEWSLDGRAWNVYDDSQPISISSPTRLYYRAEDECGRRMEARMKHYEFDTVDRSSQCPPDMEHVLVGGREFCVDRYEWPNRPRVTPSSFVSLFQAMDSCFSVRKRLCTAEEWTMACAGPHNFTYTYGETYAQNACAVRDSSVQRTGSNPECRSWFGAFDMSGNLAEWTSTQSPRDRAFNNVMGGFWESGAQSRCRDARHSYYSQNRHNPVGFRCCRDADPLPSESEPSRRRTR